MAPGVGARVKKSGQFAGVRVETREVRPLVTVAEMTSQGKVCIIVAAVVLAGNNVLNVERDHVVMLMDAAIFAAVSRSCTHA